MNERIVVLLNKLISDLALDESEQNELKNWLAQSPHNRAVYKEILNKEKLEEDIREMLLYNSQDLWNKIEERTKGKLVTISASRRWWWPAAAAVLLVSFSVAAYFTLFNHKEKQNMATTGPTEQRFKNDVAPGSEKATLTLADGTKIILDNTSNGTIATQGNAVVIKEDGLLAYNVDQAKSQNKIIYNNLTTGRSQEYKSLVLADGTKVWLNSVSSILFPTSFTGTERTVEITGEAYFEVAKNVLKPFKVKVNGVEIEVLGTHFNVNAYDDEKIIATTLLEGSVKITQGTATAILKPGQQAQADKNNNVRVINANTDEATAWKNGMFSFHDATIDIIMRQLVRWYDIDVVYENKVSKHFNATIARTVQLSELLKLLELTEEVKFRIDGKKITITR
jgi:ferric-dicitrate binding protein FerR (iron transport regulator)